MKFKQRLRATAAVALAATGVLGVLVALPPWHSRLPCIVQTRIGDWTGIYFHTFPDDFTGMRRLWDGNGRLLFEHRYTNGLRHGMWFGYETDGRKISQGEYRDGDPWDGICFIYDEKAWIGEYRQGRPWNGCLPVPHLENTEWRHFIDGDEVTESEYRTRNRIPQNARCVGLHSVKASAETR
jgi:hypothetical protein